VHGDLFDGVMKHARWINAIRTRLGLPYWSLSQ
jgi:hypothetical protein